LLNAKLLCDIEGWWRCARPEDRTRSLAAGIVLHQIKPAEPDSLVAALASLARVRYGEFQLA
jgi:hypothetical protein